MASFVGVGLGLIGVGLVVGRRPILARHLSLPLRAFKALALAWTPVTSSQAVTRQAKAILGHSKTLA